jgi:hypothetical protein
MTTEQIIEKMVGRELTNIYPQHHHKIGEVILECENISSIHEKSFRDVSFTLRKGKSSVSADLSEPREPSLWKASSVSVTLLPVQSKYTDGK